MRHRFGNAKLKRDVGARNSLFKNLTTSIILEERVTTTVPKAKAIQPMVEHMITLAKRGNRDPLVAVDKRVILRQALPQGRTLFDEIPVATG